MRGRIQEAYAELGHFYKLELKTDENVFHFHGKAKEISEEQLENLIPSFKRVIKDKNLEPIKGAFYF